MTQPIRILHLSDFHFDLDRTWDSDAVLKGLTDAVRELSKEGIPPDVVAITGDIATHGKAEEYDQAKRWMMEGLLKALPATFPEARLLIVPGNHDVDRSAVKTAAKALQSQLLNERSQDAITGVLKDPDERQVLLKRNQAYLQFVNCFRPSKALEVPWWSQTLNLRGSEVHFAGLCSSWMSWSDDDKGRLLVGRWQASTLLQNVPDAGLSVVLIHHPWSYLPDFDDDECDRVIRRRSKVKMKIVLRGHLHEQRTRIIQDPDSATLEVAAGCAYGGSDYPNAFQLVEAFPATRTVRIHLRTWRDGRWVPDRTLYDTAPDGVVTLCLDRTLAPTVKTTEVPAPPPDPSRYLRDLRDRTEYIDIRGLLVGSGKAPRFRIEELYIPLTTTSPEMQGPESPLRKSRSARDGPAVEGRPDRIELREAIKHHRLAVVGDPGAGKTTFLRRIAFSFSRQSLGEGLAEAGSQEECFGSPFPILIRIADLAAHIGAAGGRGRGPGYARDAPSWLAHFAAARCQEASFGLDEEFFRRQLEDGTATVLLDGLDEAPSARQRKDVAGLIEKASSAYQKARFVVTTRPPATLTLPPSFMAVHIDPLDDAAVETFLSRWCQALFQKDTSESRRHSAELLEALQSRPEIRRLTRNPVMLTALGVVHWNEKRLPEQRADLYESIIKWLAQSRERRPGRPVPDHCVVLLQNLALAMQDHPDGRQVQVRRHWASERLAPYWRDARDEERVELAERFLSAEELDSGIVISRGDDVRFWHLTFQEYLAARALSGQDEQRSAVLRSGKVYQPEWREVILLLAGVLYHQDIARVDGMFSAVLEDLGARPKLPDTARCVGLLGAAVRDLSPVGYTPRDERYHQALDRALAIFDSDRPPKTDVRDAINAAEALGQAGDPRFCQSAREDNWVTIPAGGFLMGAQKARVGEPNYDAEASAAESPVHRVKLSAYRIGRYPVTVCEYRQFVDDGGYADETLWRLGGFQQWKGPDGWEEQKEHPTRPVVGVSWHEAAAYAAWANATVIPGCHLPTEAQWERAARGREGRRYPWGSEDAHPSLLNYVESGIGHATPVGVYPFGATPLGVADMAGNVWEWCADWYGHAYYRISKAMDPRGPDRGRERVLRGGCWVNYPINCRSATRDWDMPVKRHDYGGFRVAVDLE